MKHTDRVLYAEFSSDKKWVATASGDGTAKVWKMSDSDSLLAKPITILEHDDLVSSVSFGSPSDRYIVTASYDCTAKLWDVFTGELHRTMQHKKFLTSATFCPGGWRIVTTSRDNRALVWRAYTGEFMYFVEHDDWINAAVFSPDGNLLATASNDHTVKVWCAHTGKLLCTIVPTFSSPVNSVAFSPDGTQITLSTNMKSVWKFDAKDGHFLCMIGNHDDWVNSVAISPDGATLATASDDRTIIFWNAATGEFLGRLYGHCNVVNSVRFSKDSKHIVTASDDGTAKVFKAYEMKKGQSGRCISFALTKHKLENRSKRQTRRTSEFWLSFEGSTLRAVEKAQGLKRGETVKDICQIVVIKAWKHRLYEITQDEVILEGFPDMRPEQFVEFFCRENKCKPEVWVTALEFKYVKSDPWVGYDNLTPEQQAQYDKCKSLASDLGSIL